MKRINVLVCLVLVAVSGLGAVHVFQQNLHREQQQRIDRITERDAVLSGMELALEHYRRKSAGFRRVGEAEVSRSKDELKAAVAQGAGRLDQLAPNQEEKGMTRDMVQHLTEFLLLSSKFEPMLYSRDVFSKEEAVGAYQKMNAGIRALRESAKAQAEKAKSSAQSHKTRLNQLVLGLTMAVAVLLGALVVSVYVSSVRPIQLLLGRSREIRSGKLKREKGSRLKGAHAEIEGELDRLASWMETDRQEKQNFLTALAAEVGEPLVPIQTNASLLAASGESLGQEQRAAVASLIRRAAIKLARSLEDLGDLLRIERSGVRLNERIADFREVAAGVTDVFNGPGASHSVRVTVPSAPIWGLVDHDRVERALINLISKVMKGSVPGALIDVSVTRLIKGNVPTGVEIQVHEGNQERFSPARASGPEQDAIRHWASENGFGVALAQRVMEAHGGTLAAAGVSGSNVVFTLRFPESRLAGNMSGRMGIRTALQPGKSSQESEHREG